MQTSIIQKTFRVIAIIIIYFLSQIPFVFSQAIEQVICEYYNETGKLSKACISENELKPNFITYRIYLDLKPGYRLQSVFGSPGHPLRLATKTSFYNHSKSGNVVPNLITEESLKDQSALLDSWISMGGGSQEQFAILKSLDESNTYQMSPCANEWFSSPSSQFGFSVLERDGLFKTGELPPRVAQIGLDSLFSKIDKSSPNSKGYEFITENGGYGCLGGSIGVDSTSNTICIGQFTTDGGLEFEFNVQIGTPEGKVEQYVAGNAIDKEIPDSRLTIKLHPPNIEQRK